MAAGFIPHFEGFEPGSDRFQFAQKMVNIPKVFFSRTLNKSFGKTLPLPKEIWTKK
jgi:hypothetical protein